MKYQFVLPGCLLLLWTLTAFVSCDGTEIKFTVKTVPDGIKLFCGAQLRVTTGKNDTVENLPYVDESTGEYSCGKENPISIFVKFRTCNNCVELDTTSIAGLVMGDVVATIAVGVAVYLIAAHGQGHGQTSPGTSHKQSSGRQPLIPNEVSSRSNNEPYQRLRYKGQKDTYDVINSKR